MRYNWLKNQTLDRFLIDCDKCQKFTRWLINHSAYLIYRRFVHANVKNETQVLYETPLLRNEFIWLADGGFPFHVKSQLA